MSVPFAPLGGLTHPVSHHTPLPPPEEDRLWFQRAVFYEVLIRGFFDGNNDGIGDIPGLIAKLDYLQWLGVDCLWLLPFYPSPLRDGGYDISDFFIGPSRVRHRRRPEAPARGGPRPGHPGHRRPGHEPHQRPAPLVHGVPLEPRQPQGRLVRVERRRPTLAGGPGGLHRRRSGPTGPGRPQREQYYWHRFYSHQPDLNYDNPEVADAMLDVVRFWLDLGLDGFRLDAVPYLYQTDGTDGENLPETHAFIRRIRKRAGGRTTRAASCWPRPTGGRPTWPTTSGTTTSATCASTSR